MIEQLVAWLGNGQCVDHCAQYQARLHPQEDHVWTAEGNDENDAPIQFQIGGQVVDKLEIALPVSPQGNDESGDDRNERSQQRDQTSKVPGRQKESQHHCAVDILRGLRIHLLPEAPVLHQIARQAAEVTAIGPVPQPEPLPFVEGKLDVATALGGALEASQVLHIATARIDDDIAYP
ncbi:hypothetical protein HKT50_19605 [Pseudomonas aeruginosa]|nr:hypothetical protein [Pseudomonas aeruginosa]